MLQQGQGWGLEGLDERDEGDLRLSQKGDKVTQSERQLCFVPTHQRTPQQAVQKPGKPNPHLATHAPVVGYQHARV